MPAICVMAAATLAFGLIGLDSASPDLAAEYPLVFGGGAEGARGLLSSIASSMITVAGVTFSITLVALQLASSQFSPRVLRNFMGDRPTQVVLGTFIGTFTYAILVLRSVRSEDEDTTAFVPSLAVSAGILLALVALGMLVYFIHHIATRIQIATIIATIADETTERIETGWTDRDEAPEDHHDEAPREAPEVIRARDSGKLQLVARDDLRSIAEELNLVVRLEVRPGEWVQEAAPLFSVWPATSGRDDVAERLISALTLGHQRSIEQDAAFGIRQLVDVALRAISPGINDPTSASDCMERLGQILVAAARRRQQARCMHGEDGALRLITPQRDFSELVHLAFDQLRESGHGHTDVLVALAERLRVVATAVPERHRPPLHRQARLIREAASDLRIADDRARLLAAVDAVAAV